MNEPLTIEELDRDGALRETAAEAGEATRKQLFKRGAALGGAGLLLGAIPIGFAAAQGLPKGDVKILNYALTLEYLEAAFYKEAVEKGELEGESLRFAQIVAAHEQAHVDALKQTLGSKAVKSPRFGFGGATGKSKFLATAQTLEDTGVAAYQGQGHLIKTGAVLAAAGSILAVEARHAAWVRDIRGGGEGVNPAPDAFEKAQDMQAILDAVEGTGFIKS
ncbi:MAG TPA: ferritin-like domain-containing protein [Solirubrobacteraceae bacterium]|nr:ferritin-like domain-containing protein [Solirubrobacteraceae bacterium]